MRLFSAPATSYRTASSSSKACYVGTLPPLDGPNLKIACLPWMSKLSNVPLSARYRLIMTQVMVDSSHETTPTLGGMRAYP